MPSWMKSPQLGGAENAWNDPDFDRLPADLREEVEYLFSVPDEDPDADPDEKWDRTQTSLYKLLTEIEDRINSGDADKKWLKPIRRWMIAKGAHGVISNEEMDRTWVVRTNGRPEKKYDYVLDGQKYVWRKHL